MVYPRPAAEEHQVDRKPKCLATVSDYEPHDTRVEVFHGIHVVNIDAHVTENGADGRG